MAISAGAILKFNCCQEGRDLPENNKKEGWIDGKINYTYCPFHYFLIISTYDKNNEEHFGWSHGGEKHKLKLCTGIPLDIDESNGDLNPFTFYLSGELIQGSPRENDEYRYFSNKKQKIVRCDKVCRLNISKLKGETICFVPPDNFDEIGEKLGIFIKRGKSQVKFKIENNI